MCKLIKYPSVVLYCCFFFFSAAYAAPKDEDQHKHLKHILDKVEKEKLFKNPTWLRLLHFRVTPYVAKHSDIISPEFFNAYDKAVHGKLSPKSATNSISAKQELIATLKSFYDPIPKDSNLHSQCRFPARFFWLDKQLNLNNKQLPNVQCNRVNEWAKFKSLDSISLIMVSGYFGNPASTFGHLLVKLNNSEHKSSSGNLLDQSINYGAQVPQSEPMPMYVAKGIFGGYVSSFSNKKFYTQDLVYSKHEFRDMWEYELNLSEEQNYLMVYHIWEMVGMKSTYYFLKENCGYRIAELLELVTGQSLTPDRQPWYLPISVFHELDEVENSRYIKKISFIPSSQRKLYYNFNNLEENEKIAVNKILAEPVLKDSILDSFSITQKSTMIDVMFDYYQYKLEGGDTSSIKKKMLKQYKNALLLDRLKLPIDKNKKPSIFPVLESPAEGSKPSLFHVGISNSKSRGDLFDLGYTAVHYDLLSNSKGSLKNSELKVFDLSVQYDKKDKLSLKELTLLSIQKLGLNNTKLIGESNLSWRFATGFKRNNLTCESCTNYYIDAGVGRAYKISDRLITYAMLDVNYHADKNNVRISPNSGLIFEYSDKIKSIVEIGIGIDIETGEKSQLMKLETRYTISKNNSIRLSFQERDGKEFTVSFYHNW